MVFANLGIVLILFAVMVTDYKKHVIYNTFIVALVILGAIRILLQHGVQTVMLRSFGLVAMFFLCIMIGYLYKVIKGIDTAGGGDYKLISVFALLFGLKGLLLCTILELIYETVYRYVLFPERRREAIPLGASFGAFGILILIVERLM